MVRMNRREILEVAGEMLGWAVAEVALALNPSRVILAGPLTLLGDILLHPIRKRAPARARTHSLLQYELPDGCLSWGIKSGSRRRG